MASLQGLVICPTMLAKQTGLCVPVTVHSPLSRAKMIRSEFLGKKVSDCGKTTSYQQYSRKHLPVQCTFSSSSDGNGSKAGNPSGNDADYVISSVVEAVEVRCGADGFMVKMRDGRHLRCVHNNPPIGPTPDYAPHPAIVLKMEDGSGLLLPIIVLETPSIFLMAAVRNVQIARPTIYQAVKDMVDKMGYTVKLVRVTKRVHEAYFAELHLIQPGNKDDCLRIDMRPSDAINIAVRCKVPIQVNKFLAHSDGMRVIDSARFLVQTTPSNGGQVLTEHDKPSGEPCILAEEFILVRNMLIAIVEERYHDAARWRDKLILLRSKTNWA